ncbi:MAG: hypothetical protein B7X08_04635 [Acidocella sp. 20-63-7]|nr:MAG: hypothetical protein B7X08_04635 [Acidocella sp. 20-63-7]HQT46561.1 hypothetical protein [Acidocella sp.]
MTRLFLLSVLGLSLGGAALAQTSPPSQAYTSSGGNKPKSSLITEGEKATKTNKNDTSGTSANVPTVPQIALHPQAPIGSGTPMSGPGGTVKSH